MRIFLCGLLGLSLILPGCGGAQVCTTDARPSLEVEVVDSSGAPILDAVVTATWDGGADFFVHCGWPEDGGCQRWDIGSEQQGSFTVVAENPDGSRHGETTVQVGQTDDGCHVETAKVTLTL